MCRFCSTYLQETLYEARWMHREDYNHILVTPRMLSDHTPDSVIRVLRGLSAQYEHSVSHSVCSPRDA